MDDKFDKKLTSRITEVFDNYEYPPADKGWAELRKKFPEKEERKIAWLWWSSAAALLLVFLGVGMWVLNKPDTNATVAIKQPIKQHTDTVKQKDIIASASTPAAKNTPQTAVIDPANQAGGFKNNSNASVFARPGINGRLNALAAVKQPAISNSKTSVVPGNGSTGEIPVDQSWVAVTTAVPDDQKSAVIMAPADQGVVKVDAPVVNGAAKATSPVIAQQPAKTIDEMFRNDKPLTKKEVQDKKELKRVNFSVYAATYFNYAEGSANQVNAGAGFTSDIALSKNIKLSTGVSVAQNTLSYNGAPPAASNGRFYADAAASPAIKQESLFSTAGSVAELQKYNASLVGLDIPLNIKFEINPDKNDTYISAGLSSGTFIDERYTYRYAYHNSAQGFSNVITQDQTSSQSFNGFYFAKTLNVAFGIGYPIGKTNRLVIEPFLKYPLGGLGAQDIHFGAGGVNLKFNFKSTKKR